MSARLVVRPEAVTDLGEAIKWYEMQRPGLGSLFKRAVWKRVRQIIESPLAYPVVQRSIRRAKITRFPFGIYYELLDEQVIVLAVYHFKRSPKGWKRRR